MVAAVRSGEAVERAKAAALRLRDDYEAGKRGDDTPPEPLWTGPRQQLDALVAALRRARSDSGAVVGNAPTSHDDQVGVDDHLDDEVDGVARLVGNVDWSAVRSATTVRSAEASAAIKALADQVPWQRIQPAASKVSSALLAAVASGQLPVGGPAGRLIVRTIVNQGDLANRVDQRLQRTASAPPDFRDVVDTTARDL